MDERLSDIFATCLRRIGAGAALDECLAAYPAERADLEPLLRALPSPASLPAAAAAAVAGRVPGHPRAQRAAAPGAPPPPRATAGPRPLDLSSWLAGGLRALGYRGPLAQPWLRLGVLALGLLLAAALAVTAYAAGRAIFPPAPLAPATRFELAGPIEAADEATITIAGVKLDLGPQTVITGTPAVGAAARAAGTIRDDGTLLAERIVVEPAALAPTAPAAPTAAPTPEPAPPPTAPPAAPAPAAPLARLRQLLEAGAADGRAGGEADAFLKWLAEAERALDQGDGKKAGDKLRDLYQKLREQAREGRTDPAFAQEAQGLIQEIAAAYGVRAIPNEGGGGGGDDDDGGDDGGDD